MTKIVRGQAHVWTLPVDPVDEAGLRRWRTILSNEETSRLEKIGFERNRREYIAAHTLKRLMLSHFSDVSPSNWKFNSGPHGRPELAGQFESTNLRFNLSHANNMVACAVTIKDDIGVDVEWFERSNRFTEIAQRKFSKPEVAYFDSVEVEDRRKVFFSFWTLKESYIKAIGKGLVEPLDGFAFSLDPLGISFLNDNGDSDCWKFDLFEASPVHFCAVCLARSGGSSVEVIRRSLKSADLEAIAYRAMP